MIEAKSRKYKRIQIQRSLSSNIKYWLEHNLTLTGMLWLKTVLNQIYCVNTKNFSFRFKTQATVQRDKQSQFFINRTALRLKVNLLNLVQ